MADETPTPAPRAAAAVAVTAACSDEIDVNTLPGATRLQRVKMKDLMSRTHVHWHSYLKGMIPSRGHKALDSLIHSTQAPIKAEELLMSPTDLGNEKTLRIQVRLECEVAATKHRREKARAAYVKQRDRKQEQPNGTVTQVEPPQRANAVEVVVEEAPASESETDSGSEVGDEELAEIFENLDTRKNSPTDTHRDTRRAVGGGICSLFRSR